ncbi:tricarballylate utilization protein B [Thermogymnomonas acidicola]|uniref:Tricarballylate utilization protein B n=1 Tax=Thermogymnomonas acidicola TaxID=399579 RepID=A0AA37F958_9ARCH|nr:hypothetical protein [Thermogymnomonas acidicola]GGM66194.1 tricarballylate utilization protein B [Thermogymnomonas acidicola]
MSEVPGVYGEALRQLTICNACRYCEGFCAVWDAIEFRHTLRLEEIPYIANLCHDCRDCYYACPFNEPLHEYRLNIPRVLGQSRLRSYRESVWPPSMVRLIDHPWAFALSSLAIAVVAAVAYALLTGRHLFSASPLTYYVPPVLFRAISITLYSYTIAMWAVQGYRFSRSAESLGKASPRSYLTALRDALTHRYFRGGGVGCRVPGERSRYMRAVFHPLFFFGFLLALASISLYPDLDHVTVAVYGAASIMMLVGSAGLISMDAIDTVAMRSAEVKGFDLPFAVALLLAGLTGTLFTLLQGTPYHGLTFLVHDAIIAAVFVIAPYSKFLHPVYRLISLAKFHEESLLGR